MTNRLRDLAKSLWNSPEDALTAFVLTAIGVGSVLDLFGIIIISGEAMSSVAITLASILALRYFATRATREHDANLLRRIDGRLQVLAATHETRASVLEVDSSVIKARLNEMLDASTLWYFRGGSGRWQRSAVLPAIAQNRSGATEYLMHILDPTDQALCARYAQYRAVQRSAEVLRPDEGRPEIVRDDLLACIYAAGWYGARSRVRPRVFLSHIYSPMRVDIASTGLMMTVSNPTASGVFAPNDSWCYQAVVDELRESQAELSEVLLPAGGDEVYPGDWTAVGEIHVRAFFQRAQLKGAATADRAFSPDSWATVDYARIAQLAFEGRA